jgi:clan AA aspartic protease (TIGR02281 family)
MRNFKFLRIIISTIILSTFLSGSINAQTSDSTILIDILVDAMMNKELFQDCDAAILDFNKGIQMIENTSCFSSRRWEVVYERELYKGRGLCYYHNERYIESIKDLSLVIELNKSYFDEEYNLYNIRGISYFLLEKYQESINDYNQLFRIIKDDDIDSESIEGYHRNRALSYYSIGNYSKSIEDISIAINMDNDPNTKSIALALRGEMNFKNHRFFSSIADFSEALELKVDDGWYLNRSIAYFSVEAYGMSCEDMKKACNLGNRKACNLSNKSNQDGVCYPRERLTLIDNTQSSKTINLPIIIENGMKYVIITIGGKEYKFLIDTGASDIVINSEIKNLLFRTGGLNKSDFLKPNVYEIANGEQVVFETAILKSLIIGGTSFSDIEIAVGNEYTSLLLGMSFLNRFDWKFINNSLELKSKE